MDKNRLSDLIRGATKVNLNYSASLLNLSKDYIKEMSDTITNESFYNESRNGSKDDSEKPDQTTTPERVPLIVAGRKGEMANAAFAVNNTSGMGGTVTLQVKGEFSGAKVVSDPETLSLDVGESAIVRVLVKIDNNLKENTDYPGVVVIPELGLKVTEFVVRRLPELKKDKGSNKKVKNKTSTKNSLSNKK
ncbi:MAG: hypothetical protein DIZ80_03150 [endosymbiont of Galathealinum brachiosum]|uniref:Uncharacterized protein n=1 Tax=endosymbiont of Galathealinum brachiosum TaxID=2200906 RepID=A0A370DIW1_9GAMM|nr:MAG: hypothetical protein DIZ80_03150 [endosymbiont of Galathealinum brachiosum]